MARAGHGINTAGTQSGLQYDLNDQATRQLTIRATRTGMALHMGCVTSTKTFGVSCHEPNIDGDGLSAKP